MTRVIHTGDTHIGYQQYNSPERRQDFLEAFRSVVEDAVADDVDAVVHAGDLFHDRRPSLVDLQGTIDVLRTLSDAEVPFLAVVGNHESKRDAQWLDLFESLDLAIRLDETPTVIGETAFYGLDFVARAGRDDLEYDFAAHDASHAALVSHGLFQPFPHGDWDATAILAEANVDFDAMLLGDDHTPARREVDGTWLTYCGSTERASASEREARGYNLVTFDDGVDIRRRSIETREFVFVDLELAAEEGVERVRNRVGQHDLEDAVVIVTIQGEGERVPPATIEEFARENGALVARVNDRREIEEEAAYDVSFADPDDAVRERIDQLGLSPAAAELDEVVRASKVADSNVDDAVESRARELIEAGDAEQFEPAPPTSEDELEADDSATDTAAASENPDESADPDGLAVDEEVAIDDGERTDEDQSIEDGEEPPGESRADSGSDQSNGDHQPVEDDTNDQTDGDGQATMGEYL